jgi:hypothetical protein
MFGISKSRMSQTETSGKMKVIRVFGFFQLFLIMLSMLSCTSHLQTSAITDEDSYSARGYSSCGESIEYVSDKYRNLDSTFPIKKKMAVDYVGNKLGEIERYFASNRDLFEKDSVSLFVDYQSDQNVAISNLYTIRDSNTIKKVLNSSVFGNQILDSLLSYCICVELVALRRVDTVSVFIKDANYSTLVGRSKSSIMRTVMKSLALMRYEYNRILREDPGVNGKLTMKFMIDEKGDIVYLKVLGSSLENCKMENNEVNIVRKWQFEPMAGKPALTTVIYPFIFSR